jgi:hypothetical protein
VLQRSLHTRFSPSGSSPPCVETCTVLATGVDGMQESSETSLLQRRAQSNCDALEKMLRTKTQRSQRQASNGHQSFSPRASHQLGL